MSKICFWAARELRASLSREQTAVIVELRNRIATGSKNNTSRIRTNEEVAIWLLLGWSYKHIERGGCRRKAATTPDGSGTTCGVI